MNKKTLLIAFAGCVLAAVGGVIGFFVYFYLSMLGVDPNHTNRRGESFAMINAVHASASVLRAMLDAGGDPNARDEHGRPIILMNGYLGYYPQDQRARLDLLLQRGADINSAMPQTEDEFAGYTLLLNRIKRAPAKDADYAEVLYLLERGADPDRAAADGTTLAKLLMHHREQLGRKIGRPPRSFDALWEWAKAHGIVSLEKSGRAVIRKRPGAATSAARYRATCGFFCARSSLSPSFRSPTVSASICSCCRAIIACCSDAAACSCSTFRCSFRNSFSNIALIAS